MYETGELRKRGGRFLTVFGVPGYQAEGVRADGRTTATRTFVAHGMVYGITVVGGQAPVEQAPEFEKVMGSFAFTEPPAPAPGPGSPAPAQPDPVLGTSALMGRIAAICIVAVVLLAIGGVVFRQLRSKAAEEDEEDEDRPRKGKRRPRETDDPDEDRPRRRKRRREEDDD